MRGGSDLLCSAALAIKFVAIVVYPIAAYMPALKLSFPHQLGQAEAVARLHGLLARVKEKYQDQVSDLKETWNDNTLSFSFSTYGFQVSGDVIVQESEVVLDGQIPFAAMMFKGRIENGIRDQMAKVLA